MAVRERGERLDLYQWQQWEYDKLMRQQRPHLATVWNIVEYQQKYQTKYQKKQKEKNKKKRCRVGGN